ncbi:rhodanese-like domain-containing protein [Neomegalonema sp.]|uniref:rhodanese-like domain-containing protein n=1 Tax=Neomegalonema sp. TaxID=2039713 RepID=UPI002616B0D7|nr:rhodanese-like domain-containing protein [Neomegalonema sp.]MDD2867508.1 PQQ-dependent catabolism-associated CXXCW motif protein [Neomegalonema sp.]
MRFAALALTILALCAAPARAEAPKSLHGVDPVTGFRMENFRAPTPDSLPGGVVAHLEMAEAASERGVYQLVDVYAEGMKPVPDSGEWAIFNDRLHLPGSIWLPGVGGGALDEATEAYFRRALERITQGDKARGLMFYCMSDCWQSWNAARRAILWGYEKVAWYPLGTDGWLEAGGELVAGEPLNFLDP